MVKIGVKRLIREEINGSVNCNPEKPVQIAAKIMEAIKITVVDIFFNSSRNFTKDKDGLIITIVIEDKKTTNS